MKYYYVDRIRELAINNNLALYTMSYLETLNEDELIGLWDSLRWKYGDLSNKSK